jgi:uncharacterized protein YjbI with pentapeptide repeats
MANKDHVEIVKRGMAVWNDWRLNNASVIPDLSGANLSGMDLSKGNFREANLGNANLANANLADADFTKANLTGTNIGGATGLTWQGFAER